MRKALIIGLFLVLLVSLVGLAMVYGDDTTGSEPSIIPLYPPEVLYYGKTGTSGYKEKALLHGDEVFAELKLTTEASRHRNEASGDLWYYNLPKLPSNQIYELWLVDVDTGYKLSMGVFFSDDSQDGRFSFTYHRSVGEYDKAVVTVEPYPDTSPWHSGDVAVTGDMNLEYVLHQK